ncbi:unnamed protein product [Mytilus coruscus]|uniref:EGF-like domain-containing protein n=1 Tax=Mytilus coruscus TaxID=42192 RepID=A0A6J8CEI3_MYTCO|nr:unnamed protein product [Mytilus coruscus]
MSTNFYLQDSDSCGPNPCPVVTKCALSKSNGYVCLIYDPVPNPCEPNQCNNGDRCDDRIITLKSFEILITLHSISNDYDRLIQTANPVPNPCEPNPCNNAGVCTELTADTFSCDCDPAWTGDRCDDPVPNPCEPNLCNNVVIVIRLGLETDVTSYGRDGVWPGYYVYADEQYPWSTSIQFDRNSITGGGSDSVGTFTINGSLNPLSKDINFVKAYTSHTVSYTCQVTADVCTMYVMALQDGRVYILLAQDDNPEYGLSAKDYYMKERSSITAAYHVAWGSSNRRQDSKYISACLNYNDALKFSQRNQFFNGQIVSIDTDQLNVLHVYDPTVRQQLNAEQNVKDQETISKFDSFATERNEVLIVGPVPANCLTIITRKQDLPNRNGDAPRH